MKLYVLLMILLPFCNLLKAQSDKNPLPDFPKNFTYKNELEQFVFIPGGQFAVGVLEGADSLTQPVPDPITMQHVILNKFEVSNGEYKRFVQYVLDSMAHHLLGHTTEKNGSNIIDWTKKIDWKSPKLEPLMLDSGKRLYNKIEIDPEKISYRFTNGNTVAVYPDTLAWTRDFEYTQNEPMIRRYFSHPSFANYPVTGVSQKQCIAYCDWKTNQWNAALKASGSQMRIKINLPTAAAWEYAAFLDLPGNKKPALPFLDVFDKTQTTGYPNPADGATAQSVRNQGYKYNFGVVQDRNSFRIKNYDDDGCFYIAPCNAYQPSERGFYNLLGNIAEWTDTKGTYDPYVKGNSKQAVEWLKMLTNKFPASPLAGLSAEAANAWLQQFIVVKGGSWESIPFYLQPVVNQYFSAGEAHCFIGFRIALTILE